MSFTKLQDFNLQTLSDKSLGRNWAFTSHLYSDGSERAPCFECTVVASWARIGGCSSSLPLCITNACHPPCCSIHAVPWVMELSIDPASVLDNNTAQLMDTDLGAAHKQHLPWFGGLQGLCQPKRFCDSAWVSLHAAADGRRASWESSGSQQGSISSARRFGSDVGRVTEEQRLCMRTESEGSTSATRETFRDGEWVVCYKGEVSYFPMKGWNSTGIVIHSGQPAHWTWLEIPAWLKLWPGYFDTWICS